MSDHYSGTPRPICIEAMFSFKSQNTQPRTSKPSEEFSDGSTEFLNQISGKSVEGFLSYKANKFALRKFVFEF